MAHRETTVSQQNNYNEKSKKITKMKFCIISNYAYMHMKGILQNFALDYKD